MKEVLPEPGVPMTAKFMSSMVGVASLLLSWMHIRQRSSCLSWGAKSNIHLKTAQKLLLRHPRACGC
jgi:hypothetical protein